MFAPIRPSPTKPIRIRGASLWGDGRGRWSRPDASGSRMSLSAGPDRRLQRRREGRLEGGHPGFGIGQVDPDDRQIVPLDRLEVTLRLGVDEVAERIRPAGDPAIDRVVPGELQKPPDPPSTPLEL